MNRHRTARCAALGLALVALAASTASVSNAAARRPDATASPARTTTPTPQKFLGSPDARDRNEGRSMTTVPEITVVKVSSPPPPSAGIDWGDAGIGAGGMLGVVLLALGATLAVVHRRRSAARGRSTVTA